MKTLGLLIIAAAFMGLIVNGAEEPSKILRTLEEKYAQMGKNGKIDPNEKIEQLGYILRWIDSPELHQEHANEARELQNKVQSELIEIPGHAEFFAQKIREEQGRIKDVPLRPVGERNTYNKNRYTYFTEVLANIPSTESVRVLGGFLSDEQDAMHPGPGQDWALTEPNAGFAAQALTSIGLRNPPLKTFQGSPAELDLWRSWYEEVKSGKRSFSFKGQNVEYRFNPDGSVSTTPIKVEEEHPAPVPRKSEAIQQQQPIAQAPAVQPARRLWIVVALIVAGLIAALVVWRKGKKTH